MIKSTFYALMAGTMLALPAMAQSQSQSSGQAGSTAGQQQTQSQGSQASGSDSQQTTAGSQDRGGVTAQGGQQGQSGQQQQSGQMAQSDEEAQQRTQQELAEVSQGALESSLEEAGYQDVQILDAAYLVAAQSPDGQPVLMMLNPPPIHPRSQDMAGMQNQGSGAEPAAGPNAGQQGSQTQQGQTQTQQGQTQ